MQLHPKLRKKLKALNRVDHGSDDDKKKQSTATILIALALQHVAELFHTSNHHAYLTVKRHNHVETWPLRSRPARNWLAKLFYDAQKKAPSTQAVIDALNVLEGDALYRGGQRNVHVRIASWGESVFLDLADADWRTVEITSAGWRLTVNPPVKFVRPRGMLPLPVPVSGGSLDLLRPLVNVGSDEDWRLMVSWLVAALRPTGPFPTLALYGEQGSAKSTTCRLLRSLIDPAEAPLRSPPRDERDLMIAASNGWIVALENLSVIPQWLSDALCRLATGGGFGTRELYTDDEERIFSSQRPVMLNGIGQVATRSDLLDRTLLVELPGIRDEKRRTEAEIFDEFESLRPLILGALLDAVVAGLRNENRVRLTRLPRMADFARWIVAAEPGLPWAQGDFMDAYDCNPASGHETALDASPVAPRIVALCGNASWTGTASDLYERLEAELSKDRRPHAWPKSPRALSNELRRLVPNLRAVGVEVEFHREPKRRVITIRTAAQAIVTSVISGAAPDFVGVRDDAGNDGADAANRPSSQLSPSPEALKNAASDDDDDGDARLQAHSEQEALRL